MRLSTTSTALILASLSAINAAPATGNSGLVARDTAMVQGYVDNMEDFNKKRNTMSAVEISKRESQIVTDVLKAIKDTDLAAPIIKYLVTDDTFEPIVTNTIIKLVKDGTINIDTLLKSLNDSGLAVSVIQDLINDCTFYSEIYKLALDYISDLAEKVISKVTSKREFIMIPNHKREDALAVRDELSILTSLMESLKDSGLASQVVRELIVDPDFLSWGADLIEQLFDDDAITVSELVSALLDSGLIPSLFKAFFNLGTLDTVITNALAAALGKCGELSLTTLSATTTASTTASPSATSVGVCRKKKRSYY